jgi:transcriptional regulator GlxA family with amidase domain
MEGDAREALLWFEQARAVAERSGLSYAAWYVAGNIERLNILLGRAREALPAIRRRLRALQSRGARYDEIVTRSNLAWALRLLGRHQEALQELDAAMQIVRDTRTANVLLEFLEYDRSLVLDALGQTVAARAGYRRYLALVGASDRSLAGDVGQAAPRRPLEPYFLKRADRFVIDHVGRAFTVADLAASCGVSLRTLEKAFMEYRGLTPVQYARNQRLDQAHAALLKGGVAVAEVAARCGFRSSTTFALEYRRRFGASPARTMRERR